MASATHVYRNGTILTMDSGGSQAQALAVRGETILAVGSDAEIMALADPHTVVTDWLCYSFRLTFIVRCCIHSS